MVRIALEIKELEFILDKISENQTLCDNIKKQIEISNKLQKKRQDIIKKATQIKKDVAKEKVSKAIQYLNENNIPLRLVNVLKNCDVAKVTAIKYLKEYKTLHNLH